jgi:hypothetical protein
MASAASSHEIHHPLTLPLIPAGHRFRPPERGKKVQLPTKRNTQSRAGFRPTLVDVVTRRHVSDEQKCKLNPVLLVQNQPGGVTPPDVRRDDLWAPAH